MKKFKINSGDMAVISTCFFLSGMCGLIYQVLWTKMLGLIFGHTSLAISTVITAFLAGLALGSFILGRISDKPGNFFENLGKKGGPWQITSYCILEITIGIFCFLSPYFFKIVEVIYLQCASLPPVSMNILRFILCAGVMLIPTMAMGATLPLISKFLISANKEVGEKLGFIYSINTAGSVLGTFLAGFVLIPNIGVSTTLYCAAIINVGIGLFLISYSKGMDYTDEKERESSDKKELEPTKAPPKKDKILTVFSIVFAMSGFASLVYELAWNRSLALALGSSTYAFSAMLTTFLFGTALGSFIFSKMSKKKEFTFLSFAIIQVSIGITSALTVLLLGNLPVIFGSVLPFIKHSYNLVVIVDFLICFCAMILPTIFIGISFPLAGKLYTNKIESLGKSIGDIYAINTIGSVSGSFLAGFVLMPSIGAQNTIILAVCFNLIGALTLIMIVAGNVRTKAIFASIIFIAITGLFCMPKWDNRVMTSGVFRGAQYTVSNAKSQEILFYKDGISSTVAVLRETVSKGLTVNVNGKSDASTGADMATQIMLGYLPIFYHQNPKIAFNLGLGSGVTVGAVLDSPSIEKVDCVEIEPTMKEAAAFFKDYNHNALEDPRFKFHVADGRNFLLSSKENYDIIISEPSNPWLSGVASCFAKEYFELCKSKLNDGGIACFWLQLYSIAPEDVKMILATISQVFPEIEIWVSNIKSDCIIICSEKPLSFKYDRFISEYKKSQNIKDYIKRSGFSHPDEFLSSYITDGKSIKPLIYGEKINTDDMLHLEYSAPVSLYTDSSRKNISGLYNYKTKLIPALIGNETMSPNFYAKSFLFTLGAYEQSDIFLQEGLKLYPNDESINICLLESLMQSKETQQLEKTLDELIKDSKNNLAYIGFKANYLMEQNKFQEAEKYYDQTYKSMPDNISLDMYLRYIYCLEKQKKYEKVISIVDSNIEKFKDLNLYLSKFQALEKLDRDSEAKILIPELLTRYTPVAYEDVAKFYLKQNDLNNAFDIAWKYYNYSNHDIKASEILIKVLDLQSRHEDARAVALDAISKDPYNRLFTETIMKKAE